MKIKKISRITIKSLDMVQDNETLKDCLRTLRKPLLDAFDVYKGNVRYGIIVETEIEHEEMIRWYHSLLDLEQWAIENPPASVCAYLRK